MPLHAASVLLVHGAGGFLGNVAMGVTGFGTAIVHLSCWAAAGALGIPAGSFQLAVVACSCALTVGMLPMLWLADARRNAVRPLAISLALAKAAGAPLGALLLRAVPPRLLEALVAALMLAMMALMQRAPLAAALRGALSRARWAARRAAEGPVKRLRSSAGLAAGGAGPGGGGRARGECGWGEGLPADGWDEEAAPGGELVPLVAAAGGGRLESAAAGAGGGSSWDGGGGGGGIAADWDGGAQQQQQQQQQQQEACSPTDDGRGAGSGSSGAAADSTSCAAAPASEAAAAAGASAAESALGPGMSRRRYWELFGMGLAAGFLSGLLGGATGVNGPPLMVLYCALGATKDQVRGTSAAAALIQDQWIGYWLAGALAWRDARAYAAAAAAGAAGLAAGHWCQRFMDQRRFADVMSGLMALCCALMGGAALGWVQLAGA